MISFINSWAKGIILAVVIATIIEIILPEGNNKKYVKTVIGIYIVFVIMYPIISKITNKNINFQSIVDDTTSKINEYESNNTLAIETSSYIEKVYKEKIEDELTKKVNEKGYKVDSLKIYVNTKTEEVYGEINNIIMEVSKDEQKENNEVSKINNETDITNINVTNSINEIEDIEIKLNDSSDVKNTDNKNVSKEEIDSLKEYISTTYEIEKDKIYINE